MRIVFLGTPDFAVASLQALITHKFNLVAVITAPDRPAGRGLNLQQSAVKKCALFNNIPVLQPEKLKDENFIASLRSYEADVQVVVAFRMLPEVVWNMPKHGTINVHASLLPNYRGAAPINWAIINGEHETGVTTFKLQHQIDTGNILLQEKIKISSEDNAGTLHDKLMHLGAELIVKTMTQLQENNLIEHPQLLSENDKHAPKLFSETCFIKWEQSAHETHNLIRGLSPYPAAFCLLQTKKLKLFRSDFEESLHNFDKGYVETDNKSYLKFATHDGFVNILELQLEGKKRMMIEDFLRGNKIN